jgi:ABC-type multidrug transport system fused ATPase/permease subunit
LNVRYREDLSPILKNLNLSFIKYEKIGLVGRTSAGKSSLISSILGFTEFDKKGSIFIDG